MKPGCYIKINGVKMIKFVNLNKIYPTIDTLYEAFLMTSKIFITLISCSVLPPKKGHEFTHISDIIMQ